MSRGASPGERRGGRTKGIPNKKTTELVHFLEEKNFDPVEKIIEEFSSLLPMQKAFVCLKLMEFIYPKRRRLDVTTNNGDIENATNFRGVVNVEK